MSNRQVVTVCRHLQSCLFLPSGNSTSGLNLWHPNEVYIVDRQWCHKTLWKDSRVFYSFWGIFSYKRYPSEWPLRSVKFRRSEKRTNLKKPSTFNLTLYSVASNLSERFFQILCLSQNVQTLKNPAGLSKGSFPKTSLTIHVGAFQQLAWVHK